MMIELTGCTGAGKSTLAHSILQVGQGQGIDMLMGDDFVLRQIRLNRLNHRWLRTLGVDLVSLSACLVTWRRHHAFYAFALPIIFRLPVGWFERLNLARNVLKKMGVYEMIRCRGSDQQMVLVDEGTLHAAHNLFVHVSVPPNTRDLMSFIDLVPLPDVVIYLRQSEAVLIERTLKRGHKRISDRSIANVECFVKRAVEVSNQLAQQPALEGRLVVVDGQQKNTTRQIITALSDRQKRHSGNAALAQKQA